MGRVDGNGAIPDGWELVRLGDVAEEVNVRAGSDRPAEVYSVTKHGGFIRSVDYFDRQVFSRDVSNYKVVCRNDFAYATIHLDEGSLGIMQDADRGLISPMYTAFRVNAEVVCPDFLYPLMKLPQMISEYTRLGEGSIHRRRSIRFDRLATLPILLPPLAEQRAIAGVLDAIDEALERTDAVIAATVQLRDSLLHELLTRGVPGWHTEWREAPGLGSIPADWEVVRLGEVLKLEYGTSLPERLRTEGDVPVIGSAGVVGFHTEAKIAGPGIVVGRKGSIGQTTWIADDFVPIDTTYYVVPIDGRVGLRFTYYVLTRENLPRLNRATGVPGLNRDDVYALSNLLPSLAEQRAIADVLDSVEEAIAQARGERGELQAMKASVADALLTGRVRVRV